MYFHVNPRRHIDSIMWTVLHVVVHLGEVLVAARPHLGCMKLMVVEGRFVLQGVGHFMQ